MKSKRARSPKKHLSLHAFARDIREQLARDGKLSRPIGRHKGS